jgi:hypothetical protein
MTDTGRTIFGGSSAPTLFTGDYTYIWASGGTLEIDIANNQYGLAQYVTAGGTAHDDSTPGASDWLTHNPVNQNLSITASGLYMVQANVNFSGTGESQERWSAVLCQNSLCVAYANPAFGSVCQGMVVVDASPEVPAALSFRFGSADTADAVTYAEIYVYKLLPRES